MEKDNTRYFLFGEGLIDHFVKKEYFELAKKLHKGGQGSYAEYDPEYQDETFINNKIEQFTYHIEINESDFSTLFGLQDLYDRINIRETDEVNMDWFLENQNEIATLCAEGYNPFDVIETITNKV